MLEIWKPVITDNMDFTDKYEVSNTGRVRALNFHRQKGNIKELKYKIDNGYKNVTLYYNNKPHYYRVCRLVLITFLPCENMKELQADHIDGNKADDSLTNLRWATPKENCNNPNTIWKRQGINNPNYGKPLSEEQKKAIGDKARERLKDKKNHPMYGRKRNDSAIIGKKYCAKPVNQFTLNGEFIREWESMLEIERQLGYTHGNIGMCCRGIYSKAYGYKWSYVKT